MSGRRSKELTGAPSRCGQADGERCVASRPAAKSAESAFGMSATAVQPRESVLNRHQSLLKENARLLSGDAKVRLDRLPQRMT